MSEFENFLNDIQPPDIEVPQFKQALRRDLKRHARTHSAGFNYKWAFFAACAFSAVSTLLAVMLWLKPDLSPAPKPGPSLAETPSGMAQLLGETQPVFNQKAADQVLQQLLLEGPASSAMDQALIEQWYRDQSPGQAIEVRALEEERIYAVRTFELTGGKKVVVYTELGGKPEEARPKTAY